MGIVKGEYPPWSSARDDNVWRHIAALEADLALALRVVEAARALIEDQRMADLMQSDHYAEWQAAIAAFDADRAKE